MIGRAICLAVLAMLIATAVWSSPDSSPRPAPRPASPAEAATGTTELAAAEIAPVVRPAKRPRQRPDRAVAAVVAGAPGKVRIVAGPNALTRSMRPEPRPENLKRRSIVRAAGVKTQPAPVISTGKRGSICGVASIKGTTMSPIAGRLRGCGVRSPVKVTSVEGVALSTPSTMDCPTAKALASWVAGSVKPTVGKLGGGVSSLKVVAHYSCRTRNNQAGKKISEHGKGRAVDIAAITLANGVSLTVLKGWRDPQQGPMLKKMHRAACGPFGTVLGPNANSFHQDHFHFDTARYRSGSYCR